MPGADNIKMCENTPGMTGDVVYAGSGKQLARVVLWSSQG